MRLCASELGALRRTGRGIAGPAVGRSSTATSSARGAHWLLALLCVCGACLPAASSPVSAPGAMAPSDPLGP
eukprot:10884935-Alexandrium_andersonii.AAC.1